MEQGIVNMITFIKGGLTIFLKNNNLFYAVGDEKDLGAPNFF